MHPIPKASNITPLFNGSSLGSLANICFRKPYKNAMSSLKPGTALITTNMDQFARNHLEAFGWISRVWTPGSEWI